MKRILDVIAVVLLLTTFSCSKEDATGLPFVLPETPEVSPEDSTQTEKVDSVVPPDSVISKDTIPTNGTDFLSFALRSDNGDAEYSAFLMTNHTIHVMAPHQADLSRLVPVFTTNGLEVHVDQEESYSGMQAYDFSDFTKPQKFRVISSLGKDATWTVVVYDLPVLIMNTPDSLPITSKTERKKGCAMQLVNIDGTIEEIGLAGVRGRGGSTWELDKKPYNIKLDKKHEILGMRKSKHWILLANSFYDRTQLHNATAFEMARMTDYPWVQSGTFVELILNGHHQGLYYLCEKIGVEKGKIDITEMVPEDLSGEAVTGGYLLESCVYNGYVGFYPFSTDYFNTTGGGFSSILSWEVKSPKGDKLLPKEQLDYIKNAMNQMESLIYDDAVVKTGAYRDKFDIETAINWYLVEEASLNEESSRTKNLYLYKDRGDKFRVGPPWDFDAWSFGLGGKTTFNAKATALYYRQLLKDPVFVKRLKEKWAVYMPLWQKEIPLFIDAQVALIHRSVLRNEQMWPKWHQVNHYPDWEYDRCVEEMKTDFKNQLEWLNWKFSSF